MKHVLLLLAAACLVLAPTASAAPAVKKPNIVLFLCDDLGLGELGSYGQTKIHTPNADKLAADGMRFTDFYSGSTVCAPSRCTLLTGYHTGHSYIRDNQEVKPEGQVPIPTGTVTLGHVLQKAGYTTAAIGKWGLGGPGTSGEPNQQGFNHFYGHLCQAVAHNHYTDHLWRDGVKEVLEGNRVDLAVGKQFAPDLMADDAIRFLKDHHTQRPDQPFFLYFCTPLPHLSLQIPQEAMAPYLAEHWPETPYDGKKHYFAQETPHAAYAAMITRIDDYLGRIMATLKELSVDDNTLVLFSSDNGAVFPLCGTDPVFFNSTANLRGYKQDLYEGGIRSPLIARWPGHIAAGSTSDYIGAFWDFLPTLSDVAGAQTPKGLDGISFLPALVQKGTHPKHEYLYWEFHSQGGSQAARINNWKAIRNKVNTNPNAPIELYDLANDPAEQRDVASANPELVARFTELMKTSRTPSELARFNFGPRKQ